MKMLSSLSIPVRSSLWLGAAVALWLALAGAAGSAVPQRRPLKEKIGLVVKFNQGEPVADLTSLLDLQVHWVREYIPWHEHERSVRAYSDFSAALWQRLDFYRAHDIGVIAVIGMDDPVAYPATQQQPLAPIDPVAFSHYAVDVARKLKAAGVRFVLEALDRPHNTAVAKLAGGVWNGAPPSPWINHYLRMVAESIARLKTVDPGVKVLSSEDVWVNHYRFLDAGLSREVSGFALQPSAKTTPEKAGFAQDTPWMQPFVAVDTDQSLASGFRRLRAYAVEKLGKTPAVWLTEWGWPASGQGPAGPMTEDLQAAFLPRAFLTADMADVQALCWFSSFDGPDGPVGLISRDGRRRPSYAALRTLGQQLGDYTFEAQLLGEKEPTTGVQALLYRGALGMRLALWSADGPPRRIRLVGALRRATAVDAVGKLLVPEADQTGKPSFPIGPAPIYVAGLYGTKIQVELTPLVEP